ncbi:hypothetical protein V8G54_021023 [Vigna mungo]|uniref:CCHC-type domain-containing protein n=1 Tax=Vigna mungo TaxID=3915 RepID=A0AAQ3NDK0_VIGMU
MIMEKIMRSMPATFDHIVVVVEESRDMEKLKIEELQSAFEAYEMRRNGRKKRDDQALKIQHVSGEEKNVTRKQYTKEEKKNMECFVCHKKGHLSYECWFNKDEQIKKGRNKEAHLAEEEESESKPLILMVATNTESSETTKDVWYVDSGCSNHMTYNKNWLTNLHKSNKSKVRVVITAHLRSKGLEMLKSKGKMGCMLR